MTAKIGHDKLSSMEEGSMEERDMKDEESEREVVVSFRNISWKFVFFLRINYK